MSARDQSEAVIPIRAASAARPSAFQATRVLTILVGIALLVCAIDRPASAIIAPPRRAKPQKTAAAALSAPFNELTARAMQGAWARQLKRKSLETNSIGIELVLIPPGTFELGSNESLPELVKAFPSIELNVQTPAFKSAIESEQPQHRVRITKPFYIGRYNVTRAQFQKFVENTAYRTEAEADRKGGGGYAKSENPLLVRKPDFNWRETGFEQQDDTPVVNVSWNDATLFCRWLSRKEGKTYRLATNAEWEYACRAGTTTRYSTGSNPDELPTVANVADIALFTKLEGGTLPFDVAERRRVMGLMVNGNDRYAFTSPVGKFKPNAFGLFDMHGNASTWCSDWWGPKDYSLPQVDDPPGLHSGSLRVARGGNWQAYPAICRSACRLAYPPTSREAWLGFRVVCEVDAK